MKCSHCKKNEVPEDDPICDDCYNPDWTGKCGNCDHTPIVPFSGLCGPCHFGEAATIDGSWGSEA